MASASSARAMSLLRSVARRIWQTFACALVCVSFWQLGHSAGARQALSGDTHGARIAGPCANQDAPVRRRSQVDACGRWVVEHYSDRKLAEYGILDVTKAPYSADPTGNNDSTRAIQHAMKDARDARLITYFPGGTYRVSNTLTCVQGVVSRNQDYWAVGSEPAQESRASPSAPSDAFFYPCVLMGSRSGMPTEINLAARSPGFGDPERPKPIIHFWTRGEQLSWFPPQAMHLFRHSPDKPSPSDSYNNMIVDMHISIGGGNPGAVGIEDAGAEMSVIEDVRVDAHGAFAGIERPPAGGGGIHGLTVLEGRYGLYIKPDPYLYPDSFGHVVRAVKLLQEGKPLSPDSVWPDMGSMPEPVISDVTLKGQSERSILYAGQGSLTVVGGWIEGAAVQAQYPRVVPTNGAMNFVDTVFRPRKGGCAISSNHSVYLRNVYFEHAKALVCIEGQPEFDARPQRWIHVEEYAAGATLQYPKWLGGALRQDPVYIDGRPLPGGRLIRLQASSADPPADLQTRHAWSSLPSWDSPGVTNVKAAPGGAKGDGKTDDAAAIQRAIDENDAVFLPKGVYKLSRPLVLKSHTVLFGVSNVLSVLSPMWSAQYDDPYRAMPLIDTVDDPHASTVLAFVELRVPVIQPAVYALRWRAGRRSVVRDISPLATSARVAVMPAFNPLIRIEGSGGGRWYDLNEQGWWVQNPDYRHLLVEGTREPLSFYSLFPEHGNSDVEVEFRDARNIDVYGLQYEGIGSTLWVRDCRNLRIYGYWADGTPLPSEPAIRIENSANFLLSNVDPVVYLADPANFPAWVDQLLPFDPRQWLLISDEAGRPEIHVGLRGTEQFVLYERGNP